MTLRHRAYLSWLAGIVFLAVVTLLLLGHLGSDSRRFDRSHPFGVSALRPVVVDSGVDAYRIWKQRQLHGRQVVVLVGEWERVDTEALLTLPEERHYPLELFSYATALENTHLDPTTFLYVATVTGIARELFIILPETLYSAVANGARGAKNARVDGNTLHLGFHGLPRTFAPLAGLPHPSEPVLLYVDASFFYDQTPEAVYKRLHQAGLRTDCVILAEQSGNWRVTATERARLHAFAGLFGGGA